MLDPSKLFGALDRTGDLMTAVEEKKSEFLSDLSSSDSDESSEAESTEFNNQEEETESTIMGATGFEYGKGKGMLKKTLETMDKYKTVFEEEKEALEY